MEESGKIDMYVVHLPFTFNEAACCSNSDVHAKKIRSYNQDICKNTATNNDDSWCVSDKKLAQLNKCPESFKCLQTDDLNLFLSDMLLSSAEQVRWDELKTGLNFNRPVPARAFFNKYVEFREILDDFKKSSANSRQMSSLNSEKHKQEGNSVFYEYAMSQPSTSRQDDYSTEELSSSPCEQQLCPVRKFSSQQLRDSVRNALFSNYFGQRQPLRRSSSATSAVGSRRNASPINSTELAESEWKYLASFIEFPQELVALPNEICHDHRLVRTTSGKQYIQRWRRHSSSSSTSSSNGTAGGRRWASPRRKFIYELTTVNHKDFNGMLSQQDYRCAGCSRLFDDVTAKRSRLCHYYSKLFCQCCHQGAKYVIPAQILHNWNFKKLTVCDIALNFLRENSDQPVFNVPEINPSLYKRVKALRKMRDLRIQVSHMWQYIQLCPNIEHIVTSHGYFSLKTMFTSVSRRFLLLESVHMFSIFDFVSIINRNLFEMLEPLVNLGREHIEHCLECRQQAFICQICGKDADVLFPFQLERVYRCESCGALSHMKCYVQALKAQCHDQLLECAKCERIRHKRIRQFQRSPS